MAYNWRPVRSDRRGELRLYTEAAFLHKDAEGTAHYAWRRTYSQPGRRAGWVGAEQWDEGSADVVLKVRYGLSEEGCVLHTEEALTEALQQQHATPCT